MKFQILDQTAENRRKEYRLSPVLRRGLLIAKSTRPRLTPRYPKHCHTQVRRCSRRARGIKAGLLRRNNDSVSNQIGDRFVNAFLVRPNVYKSEIAAAYDVLGWVPRSHCAIGYRPAKRISVRELSEYWMDGATEAQRPPVLKISASFSSSCPVDRNKNATE